MKDQRGKADQRFGKCVTAQQIFPTGRITAGKPGARTHATHEKTQYQRLCVRCVSEEKFQVMGPD